MAFSLGLASVTVIAEKHPFLHLEMPASGGHVGFMGDRINGTYWSEKRALDFLGNDIGINKIAGTSLEKTIVQVQA